MCGIAGFIGSSNNYDITYSLIQELFNQISTRGEDASGFWGTGLEKNFVIYQKEPLKSTLFTGINSYWKYIQKNKLNMCLAHARLASPEYGNPSFNFNNHPFIYNNGSISLIHNGKVNKDLYKRYKDVFSLKTECDSELYLKFLQLSDDIVDGLKNIKSYLNDSKYAIAVGQRVSKNKKKLFLIRNNLKPLFLVNVKDLNQIFFTSTQEIWDAALLKLNIKFKKYYIREISENEILEIELNNNKLIINSHDYKNYDKKIFIKPDKKFKLITGLDNYDNMNLKLENNIK